MEERASYLNQTTKRHGKQMVGGYISDEAALRLRKACELNGCTMVELLEQMAMEMRVTFSKPHYESQ